MSWLESILPHALAVSLVFLLSLVIFAGLLGTIGLVIISQGQALLSQSTDLLNYIISLLERLENILRNLNFQIDLEIIGNQIQDQLISGVGIGLATFQGFLEYLINFIIILVVAFFMLLDGGNLWQFILKLLPKPFGERLTLSIRRNFLGFFWGRLILSVFFGVSVFIILIILQIPYALFLATIAGVFDLIPGIGATLGISLVSLIILPQGFWLSLQVLLGCILLQQVEENLLMPRVMQGSINLNPVVLFFALLIGLRVAGLLGLFLSVPIAGVIVSLLDIEEMQGE